MGDLPLFDRILEWFRHKFCFHHKWEQIGDKQIQCWRCWRTIEFDNKAYRNIMLTAYPSVGGNQQED